MSANARLALQALALGLGLAVFLALRDAPPAAPVAQSPLGLPGAEAGSRSELGGSSTATEQDRTSSSRKGTRHLLRLVPELPDGKPLEFGDGARLLYRSRLAGVERWSPRRSTLEGQFVLELPAETASQLSLTLIHVEHRGQRYHPLSPAIDPVEPGTRPLILAPGELAVRAFDRESGLPIEEFRVLIAPASQPLGSPPHAGLGQEVIERLAVASGTRGLALVNGYAPPDELWITASGYRAIAIRDLPGGILGTTVRVELTQPLHAVLVTERPGEWAGLRVTSQAGLGAITYARTRLEASNFEGGRARVPVGSFGGELELNFEQVTGLALAVPSKPLLLSRPLPLVNGVETFNLDTLLAPAGPWASVSGIIRDVPEELDLAAYSLTPKHWNPADGTVSFPSPQERGGRILRPGPEPRSFEWGPLELSPGEWIVELAFLGLAEHLELASGQTTRLEWSLSRGLVQPEFEIVDVETGERPRAAGLTYAVPGPGSAIGGGLPIEYPGMSVGSPLAAGAARFRVHAHGYRPYAEDLEVFAGPLQHRIELQPAFRLRVLSSGPGPEAFKQEAGFWWRPQGSQHQWLPMTGAVTRLDDGSRRLRFEATFWQGFAPNMEWFGPVEWPDAPRLPRISRLDPEGIITVDLAEQTPADLGD